MSSPDSPKCSICASERLRPFFHVEDVPVHVCVMWPSRESAKACPKGTIRLMVCPDCGHIFNEAFDPAIAEYTETYENSLAFSETFQAYARSQVEGLIDRYSLKNKTIVEIGCGDGSFLAQLCEEGNNQGFGYDPSHSPEDAPKDPRVKIYSRYYDASCSEQAADLVMARQVFEHIPDPMSFLKTLRRTLGQRTNTGVFFEVPSMLDCLERFSIWEIIYEHVNYFSPASIKRAFSRAGFDILGVEETYNNAYLTIDAKPSNNPMGKYDETPEELEKLCGQVDRFETEWKDKVDTCREALEKVHAAGLKAAAWGGGARGVNFLNFLGVSELLPYVVDINPRKHGKFVPGTAQEIVPPEFLKTYQPNTVVIFNPIYTEEIQADLRGMGVNCDVVTV